MQKSIFQKINFREILAILISIATLGAQGEQQRSMPSTMIINQELEITINPDGSYHYTEYTKEKAISDEGRVKLSVKRIPFDPTTTEIKLIGAGYEEPDTSVKTIPMKDFPIDISGAKIKDYQSDLPGISGLKVLEIPFDGVSNKWPVWYKIEKKEKSRTGSKSFSMNFVTGYEVNEISSTATIISDQPLNIQTSGPKAFTIEKKFDGKKHQTKIIKTGTVAPFSLQELASFSIADFNSKIPRVQISTAKDWRDLITNAAKPYNAALTEKTPPQLDPIIKKLKKLTSVKEQTEEILSWLSVGMTYSTRWLGENPGYNPRSISAIVQSKVGDCKDYAALTLHLMNAAGIKGEPVLVGMFAQGDPQRFIRRPIDTANPLAGEDYFNHVVVRYKDADKSYIIDPGRGLFDSRTLPFFLSNSWMLPLGDVNNKIFQAPSSSSENSIAKLNTVFKRKTDGQFMAETDVTLSGELANYFKMVYHSKGEAALNALLATLGSVGAHKNFTVENNKPVLRDTAPLEFKLTYSLGEFVKKSTDQRLVLLPHFLPILGNQFNNEIIRVPSLDFELTETRTIKNAFVADEASLGCFALGPSIVIKRTVENANTDVVISDFIKQYNWSYEPQTKADKDLIQASAYRVRSCFENGVVTIQENGKPNQTSFAKSLSGVSEYIEPTKIDKSLLSGRIELRKIDYFLKLNPKNDNLLNKKAKLTADQGYISNNDYILEYLLEAENILKQAIAINPNQADHHARMGRYQYFRGKLPAAMATFNKASALSPKNFNVLQLGGDLSLTQKQFDHALGYFKAAEVVASDFLQKKIALGLQISTLCEHINKCTDAIPTIEKLLQIDGKDPWTLNNMAIWYQSMGNNMKSIELLRKALAISSFGAAQMNLVTAITAEVQSRLKNRTPASVDENKKIEELLAEGYKINPKNFALLNAFVDYHLELGKKNPDAIKLAKNYLNEMKTAEYGNIFKYLEVEKIVNAAATGIKK